MKISKVTMNRYRKARSASVEAVSKAETARNAHIALNSSLALDFEKFGLTVGMKVKVPNPRHRGLVSAKIEGFTLVGSAHEPRVLVVRKMGGANDRWLVLFEQVKYYAGLKPKKARRG